MPAEIRKSGSDKQTQEVEETATQKTQGALKSRDTAMSVPHHPALDMCRWSRRRYTRRAGVDWMVFGVTALIARGISGLGIRQHRIRSPPRRRTPSVG